MMSEFTTQGLANRGQAFAALALARTPFLAAFGRRAAEMLPAMRPQELSNIAWARGTLLFRGEHLVDALSHQAIAKVHRFKERDLAETKWVWMVCGETCVWAVWDHISPR